jgi:hypothetical protein
VKIAVQNVVLSTWINVGKIKKMKLFYANKYFLQQNYLMAFYSLEQAQIQFFISLIFLGTAN